MNQENLIKNGIRQVHESEVSYLVDKGILGCFSFIYDTSKNIVTWAYLPELNFLLGKSMKEVREIGKKCSVIRWIKSVDQYNKEHNERLTKNEEERRMLREEIKNPTIQIDVPIDYVNPKWEEKWNEDDWKSYTSWRQRSSWSSLSTQDKMRYAINAERRRIVRKIVYNN